MLISNRRRGVVAATAAAVLLGTAACTDNATSTEPTAENSAGPAEPDPDVAQRRAGRAEGMIVLGDLNKPKTAKELGSPVDPCVDVTWDDFPEQVRPTDGKPHTPTARKVTKDEGFTVRCVFENSGSLTLNGDGTIPEGVVNGGTFLVSVVWGPNSGLNADPAKRKGSNPRSWNGKPGLVHKYPPDEKKVASCVGLVKLSTGIAAVSVSNSRYPKLDACAPVDSVLNAITSRTP